MQSRWGPQLSADVISIYWAIFYRDPSTRPVKNGLRDGQSINCQLCAASKAETLELIVHAQVGIYIILFNIRAPLSLEGGEGSTVRLSDIRT